MKRSRRCGRREKNTKTQELQKKMAFLSSSAPPGRLRWEPGKEALKSSQHFPGWGAINLGFPALTVTLSNQCDSANLRRMRQSGSVPFFFFFLSCSRHANQFLTRQKGFKFSVHCTQCLLNCRPGSRLFLQTRRGGALPPVSGNSCIRRFSSGNDSGQHSLPS